MVVWVYFSNDFTAVFGACSVVIVAANILLCRWLHKEGYNELKKILNAIVFFFIGIPGFIHVVVLVAGIVVAAVEGWPIDAGIFHYKQAFGLISSNPYGQLKIVSNVGRIISIFWFGISFSWFQFIVGFSGGLEFIQSIASNMSSNPIVFYVGVVSVAVPLCLLSFATPLSIIFAIAEGRPVAEAFIEVTAFTFAANGAAEAHLSDVARAYMNTIAIWSLALTGGIIGFYSAHPATTLLLKKIEVIENDATVSVHPSPQNVDSQHENTDPKKQVAESCSSDTDALTNEIVDLKKQVAELQAENARLRLRGTLGENRPSSCRYIAVPIGKYKWVV